MTEPQTIDELKTITDIPVVIVNEEGLITYVNEKFTSVFGWNDNESLGNSLTIMIPKELHDSHNMGFSRFVLTGEPKLLNQPLKLKAVNKRGEEFDAEHYIMAEKINGHWVIGASVCPLKKTE